MLSLTHTQWKWMLRGKWDQQMSCRNMFTFGENVPRKNNNFETCPEVLQLEQMLGNWKLQNSWISEQKDIRRWFHRTHLGDYWNPNTKRYDRFHELSHVLPFSIFQTHTHTPYDNDQITQPWSNPLSIFDGGSNIFEKGARSQFFETQNLCAELQLRKLEKTYILKFRGLEKRA